MTWYRTGTVAVTSGSPNLVGTGTAWVGSIDQGFSFRGPDGKVYEVINVVDDTHATLATNYEGSTATGQAYGMYPTQGLVRSLTQQVKTLLEESNVNTLAAPSVPMSDGDKVIVYQGGAGKAAELQSLFKQYLYVRGLDVSGATSATSAINTAINGMLALGGGTVALPQGTLKANVALKPGTLLIGHGKGQKANITGSIPMLPSHTFAGGGTTLVPDDRAQPVIKASGTGGATTWPTSAIRDLKISDTGGAITAGTVGILAELVDNVEVWGCAIHNMAQAVQFSTTGKTAWGHLVAHTTIADCGAGILNGQSNQNATPVALLNVDIRRCTGLGADFLNSSSVSWQGGTVADCGAGGVRVRGGRYSGPVTIQGVEFETNTGPDLIIGNGDAYSALGGAVTVKGCGFRDYRGSAGNGSVYPSVYPGKISISYNMTSSYSKLVLEGCAFTTIDTVLAHSGAGKFVHRDVTLDQCGSFGATFGSVDRSSLEWSAANSTGLLGMSLTRMYVPSNNFSVYGNNFTIQPSNTNGALAFGFAPIGTGNYAQIGVYGGADVDNTHAAVVEATPSVVAVRSVSRGTGVAKPLVLAAGATDHIKLDPSGALGFFGAGGMAKQTLPAAAVDESSSRALVNAIRAVLVGHGLCA
mgnify:CR=1 FL=1